SVRNQAKGLLDLARHNMPFSAVRGTLETASSILEQDYRGNINIYPEVSLWRYINVTRNPSIEAVKRLMLEGERATWPRMEMIRNQTMIAQTLDRCVDKLEHAGTGVVVPQLPRKPGLRIVRQRE